MLLAAVAAAQGFDQGNVGAQPLGLNVQEQQLLGKNRPSGLFGGVAAEQAALIMGASAVGGGLRRGDLQLLQRTLLIQVVKLAGADGDIANRVQHRLVVLFDQNIAGGAHRLQIGVQTTAVEDRQIEPGQQVDLLERGLKQIPDAEAL